MKLFELTAIPAKTKRVVLVFGRFNQCSIGHGKLFAKAKQIAGNDELMIVPTKTVKTETDPLTFDQKVDFIASMFPEIANDIVLDPDFRMIFYVAKKINEAGATHLVMVVGSDRVAQFKAMLTNPKYNNRETGEYYFDKIEIVSAGERDPDSEGVEGMSASKMRQAATNDDINAFAQGVPPGFKRTEEMFNAVKNGMGLTEDADNKDREKYVAGSKAGKFIYSGWG